MAQAGWEPGCTHDDWSVATGEFDNLVPVVFVVWGFFFGEDEADDELADGEVPFGSVFASWGGAFGDAEGAHFVFDESVESALWSCPPGFADGFCVGRDGLSVSVGESHLLTLSMMSLSCRGSWMGPALSSSSLILAAFSCISSCCCSVPPARV